MSKNNQEYIIKITEKVEIKLEYYLFCTYEDQNNYLADVSRFWDYNKLIQSTVFVIRFVTNIKRKDGNVLTEELVVEEYKQADKM